MTSIDEQALSERLVTAMKRPEARSDAFARRAPTFTADWIVRIGSIAHLVRCEAGRVSACEARVPLLHATRLSVSGSARAWQALWETMPRAGWHDLFALTKRGEMHIEGDMQFLLAHLQYVKDVLNLPRQEAR
ncbi:conserved hypothetical protein [Paraburkholderia unamae]|uniref:hypothetical protein n=1 Tax=Paraburkholderia unamae TaxID=219649 RepID=UPI000DC35387|nr:hypothetical protein [Paraburkholderia unamae]RAR57930.1 hypothetical protein C7401_114149 [Paraburkholderia unamae]CAG9259730.1 conserved hypothetical protein [Paraburkholderia unamae]